MPPPIQIPPEQSLRPLQITPQLLLTPTPNPPLLQVIPLTNLHQKPIQRRSVPRALNRPGPQDPLGRQFLVPRLQRQPLNARRVAEFRLVACWQGKRFGERVWEAVEEEGAGEDVVGFGFVGTG